MIIQCNKCGATIRKGSHSDSNGWCDDKGEALVEVAKQIRKLIADWIEKSVKGEAGGYAFSASQLHDLLKKIES